jgi:hypothetical protein
VPGGNSIGKGWTAYDEELESCDKVLRDTRREGEKGMREKCLMAYLQKIQLLRQQ